jgi:flagellin
MGLRIRTNLASINGQRQLAKSTEALQSSMEKLSSGQRINKAADDAAGLAVSENLKATTRSLSQAKRNAMDGASMIQVAEGGMEETSSMLIRLRELATQAASDTIGSTEREFLHKEFLELKDEIDRVTVTTEYNGTRLLMGTRAIGNPDTGLIDGLGDDADGALLKTGNGFPLEIQVGKDYFEAADGLTVQNQADIIKIDMQRLGTTTLDLGLGATKDERLAWVGAAEGQSGRDYSNEYANGASFEDFGTGVINKDRAQKTINSIDGAMQKVNEHRAYLGAIQNRLGSSMRNLDVQVENLSASNSRIRDTDFASETAVMTQASIMQQAGSSILAQAKSQPEVALSLLR